MSMISVSAASKPAKPITRPVTSFAPSLWGEWFLNYTPPDAKAYEGEREQAKQLKEKIRKELMCIGDMAMIEQLRLIDSIERLGVGYHFEKEIDDALLRIYETEMEPFSSDLFLTSLRFRLLRQHGFKVSSDFVEEFIDSEGGLKKEVANDIPCVLSLYEACYVRVHGEDALEKALPLVISILSTCVNMSEQQEERVRHALELPLQRRATRHDCVRYMKVYEEDDPSHNKALLKFAKLDFNLVQALHKEELSELCRDWKRIGFPGPLPLRYRMVEGHSWALGGYFEPCYSLGRKITCVGGHLVASIDDIYDSYATLEEAQMFTQAVDRWDESCLEELPEGLRWFYITLILDAHEEFERLLAPTGRSHLVEYARKEVKAVCRNYLNEATWRNNNHVPTLKEYMENDLYRNIGYVATLIYALLGMDTATHRDFEWVCNLAPAVKGICHITRVYNDIGGNKFDQVRGASGMYVECYMKEHGLTREEACKELYKETDESWKDITQGMIAPLEVAEPICRTIRNMGRAVEYVYGGGQDGYTAPNDNINQAIKTLYIHPLVI